MSKQTERKRTASTVTSAAQKEICRQIANGLSLRKICAKKDMPHIDAVRRLLRKDTAFQTQYSIAREEQADYYADKIIEIADNASDIPKARLQIDAIKWVASKLKPKRYGDRLAVGGDSDMPPIQKSIAVSFVSADG